MRVELYQPPKGAAPDVWIIKIGEGDRAIRFMLSSWSEVKAFAFALEREIRDKEYYA